MIFGVQLYYWVTQLEDIWRVNKDWLLSGVRTVLTPKMVMYFLLLYIPFNQNLTKLHTKNHQSSLPGSALPCRQVRPSWRPSWSANLAQLKQNMALTVICPKTPVPYYNHPSPPQVLPETQTLTLPVTWARGWGGWYKTFIFSPGAKLGDNWRKLSHRVFPGRQAATKWRQ